jgi:NTE family protein
MAASLLSTIPALSQEKTVLVLQSGGALGAYQAGAYEALAEARQLPRWVAGISIGAINAAIIAGNQLDQRVPRLREFWKRVSSRLIGWPLAGDGDSRRIFNEFSAALVATGGAPGFFEPRFPPAVFMPPATAGHTTRTRRFRFTEFWTGSGQHWSRAGVDRRNEIF